ncbi:MAG TPA: molybdopterin cofactor-binding domain-containing protein, partial [Candidatus Binataceae bacterium]|nr:molybdopterin cofactor-binding domain-containing protein [Candidatus Binataceae bacterium]
GKVEVGQNARTALTEAVAQELGAPFASIEMVMGDTDRTPFDMGTFGSMTTPTMSPQLRKIAAAAKEALIGIAAQQWQVQPSTLQALDGKVTDGKRSVAFGELARNQELYKQVAADASHLTPAKDWKVLGTSAAKVDGRAFVTGSHQYPSDIKRPGMLHGRVLRPERFGAKLVSLDQSAAQAMDGVSVVRDGDFVGVSAPTPHQAQRALAALKAEWSAKPQPSQATLFADLKREGRDQPGARMVGSMEQGLAAADHQLDATYTVAYIAHAPLEPRAAVAEWTNGKLTVWTGTQRPFGVKGELAEAFGIPEDRVRVLMPDCGSGYGGKHTGEAAVEAARLAKAAGKPVKLVWSREEEFTWAYFRPAGVIDVSSGVTKDGRITAWEFHNYLSGNSGIGTMYDIPNQKIQFHQVSTPLRVGSYRGLAATANHFARESHMDELSAQVNMDPLAFRFKNLKDDRLRAVLERTAERFGWGKNKSGAGVGYGIAGGFEKGGYVAACVEVRCEKGKMPRIERVVETFECGAVVNPDQLKLQIEGAIMMGVGGAMFEAIQFDDGKILNPHFAQYRVPRFSDMPLIEALLIDRKDLPPAGAGETPIVALAPAVANAVFAATGRRVRSMPMGPELEGV